MEEVIPVINCFGGGSYGCSILFILDNGTSENFANLISRTLKYACTRGKIFQVLESDVLDCVGTVIKV